MLRRTKDTLVNGKPILELPERIVKTVDCEFDEEERAFYDTVQVRVHARLEALQKQGGVANNYTSMLVLLLRLRQGQLTLVHSVEQRLCVLILHL